MLREIEMATAKVKEAELVSNDGRIARGALNVSISKADTEAAGRVARELLCVCDSPGVRAMDFCPACALARLRTGAVEAAPLLGDQAPLFVNIKGGLVSKGAVRGMAEKAALLLGMSLGDRVSGHSFRATGATYLASQGVSKERIASLGRWTSSAIERYLRNAPVFATASISADAVMGLVDHCR